MCLSTVCVWVFGFDWCVWVFGFVCFDRPCVLILGSFCLDLFISDFGFAFVCWWAGFGWCVLRFGLGVPV